MLKILSYELAQFLSHAKIHIHFILKLLAGLWGIHGVNMLTGYKLNRLGIYPRNQFGFFGVFCSFLLHKDFNHLFFNSIPLFALALFMCSFSLQTFLLSTVMIVLLSGIAVWLLGRKARHIGASGVIMGYFGFILASAYLKPTFTSFFLAGIALYYFGSILLSVFPTEESVSWESHLFGFIAGIATLYTYPMMNRIIYTGF